MGKISEIAIPNRAAPKLDNNTITSPFDLIDSIKSSKFIDFQR